MANPTFNLSAFAEKLIAERRKLNLAWKIKNAVGLQSIAVDLKMAVEACDALLFSLDNKMDQPADFRESSEAALMNFIILLYARAAKTSSDERQQYDPRASLTPEELVVHQELCDLRDAAVAHYGTGRSYVGNWVRELAIMEIGAGVRVGVVSRRQIIDRPLIARAKAQILRVMEIVDPIASERINGISEALDAECELDSEFYREVHAHPLNVELFLGGAEQVVQMQNTPYGGSARGTFGQNR